MRRCISLTIQRSRLPAAAAPAQISAVRRPPISSGLLTRYTSHALRTTSQPKCMLHTSRWIQDTPPVSASANSAASLSSLEQSYFDMLAGRAPCFPISSDSVRILSTPTEFYHTLHNLLSGARSRICLSSLYLGTGEHEQNLVGAIKKSMDANPSLRTHVVLDYLRGTRPVGEKKENSITTLQPLLTHAAPAYASASSAPTTSRFTLSLLHVTPPAPPLISWSRYQLEKRFFTGDKTREAVGVHHMKFYVVDDVVIISGANLSDTYFTNRQDRYILIRDANLAAFYENLAQRIHQLPTCKSVQQTGKIASHTPEHDQERAVNGFLQLFEPANVNTKAAKGDTFVFPTTQMAYLNCHHDELITKRIFESLQTLKSTPANSSSSSHLTLATGYLNVTDGYLQLLLKSAIPVSFIAAAREANGWWGAKGSGRFVPELYAEAASRLLKTVAEADKSDSIKLLEWSKEEWSYHAKGLWLASAEHGQGSAAVAHPFLSIIGSPNFGARSVERDTESSLILLTRSDSVLAKGLQAEMDNVLQHASVVVNEESSSVSGSIFEEIKDELMFAIIRGTFYFFRAYM